MFSSAGAQPSARTELSVSVVIGSLGAARLDATLASLDAAAAFADAELEVVIAWEGIAEPPSSTERVRYLDVFPAGLANARNRGLESTKGEFVAFVDDDEVVDEGWAKGMLTAFERPPLPDGVFGAVVPADDSGTAYCRFDGSEDRIFTGATTRPWHIGTGGNMAFRRDVIVKAGGFDPTFGKHAEAMSAEETELMLRLLRAGSALVWTPDMRVYHPTKQAHERIASRRIYGFGMGRALRRQRATVTAGKYVLEAARVASRAAAERDRVRLREVGAQLTAFGRGIARPRTWPSPLSALRLAPPAIQAELGDAKVVPIPAPDRPRPHFLYAVGTDRILHVYGSPAPTLSCAFEARAEMRADVSGIPQDIAVAAGRDSLWVLEERLPGEHPSPGAAPAWFNRVSAWALALAGAPGAPFRADIPVHAIPTRLHAPLADAQEAVGELPSVRVHGDLSRKNVLLDGARVGAVDWEDCHTAGIPGRDILFLAVGATSDRPDRALVHRLARGENPDFGDVLGPLSQLGVPREKVRALLLTVLAGWAADENRRVSEVGTTDRKRPYLELLAACADDLVSSS